MNSLLSFLRFRYLFPALIVASMLVIASGKVWSSISTREQDQEKQLSRSEIERILNNQIKDGLGKEVRFDSSSPSQIKESVESAAIFIQRRSGLALNPDFKTRIVTLEQEYAAGRRGSISADQLADSLADIAMERLAEATDEQILQAATTLNRRGDGIILRANGRGHTNDLHFLR